MSTSTNKGGRSSLPSVEAWENEGGATAPRPAKQTASSRKSSAFRGQDEREPQNTGSRATLESVQGEFSGETIRVGGGCYRTTSKQ